MMLVFDANLKIFLSALPNNHVFGYSIKVPQQDIYNEYPHGFFFNRERFKFHEMHSLSVQSNSLWDSWFDFLPPLLV